MEYADDNVEEWEALESLAMMPGIDASVLKWQLWTLYDLSFAIYRNIDLNEMIWKLFKKKLITLIVFPRGF